jgi:molecular chaperone Hsp33
MDDRNRNYMVRATAFGGRVRAFAIDATAVAAELHRRHDTVPAATAAIGQLAAGTLLLGAMLKEDDQLVTVRVRGDGPGGVLLASANGRGEVRALIGNPRPDVEQVRNGKLNVAGVVGTAGRLSVTRDLGMRQPYMGLVELVSGELGEDLAHFFATSEQTPSAVGIGVFVRANGSVEAAGGYIVQLLPGLHDRDALTIEGRIRELPHPTTLLRAGESPEDVLHRIFDGDVELLDRIAVRFHCPCSLERAERALLLLGEESILDMIGSSDSGGAEMRCEFCTEVYTLSENDLRALARTARTARG